jgi:hypothetical protein
MIMCLARAAWDGFECPELTMTKFLLPEETYLDEPDAVECVHVRHGLAE